MVNLETRIQSYIKNHSEKTGMITLPLSQIAEDVNSSIPTVWRVIQKLEEKRIVKVVRPKLKTQPNIIYYLGDRNELHEMVDSLMIRTGTLLVLMKEIRQKVKEQEDLIFELKHKR